MNLMTALTAVGPTYVLPVLDAMITAGIDRGLDRHTAVRLAVATVVGTARTLEESGLEAEQVKLLTGLRPLKDAEVRSLIADAITDAVQRMDGLTAKFA
jgi:pyrroline-5-carboxylate reductase